MTTHTTPAFKAAYAPLLREVHEAPYNGRRRSVARKKLRKAVTENLRKEMEKHASA